jgi:transposase
MAIRYDENTKVRAVRLVREHVGDYGFFAVEGVVGVCASLAG